MTINTRKVVLGGLAAGVVLAVLDFVANGLLLADQNAAAMEALNPELAASVEGASTAVVFIAVDLIFGILLVWTYAAIRPRFGAGPKTAMIAGIQIWLVAMLLYFAMTFIGMWTWSYFLLGAVVFLASVLIAAWLGGKLYTEV